MLHCNIPLGWRRMRSRPPACHSKGEGELGISGKKVGVEESWGEYGTQITLSITDHVRSLTFEDSTH